MKNITVSADTQLRFRVASNTLAIPLERVVGIYSEILFAVLDRDLVEGDFGGKPSPEGLERDGYCLLPVSDETWVKLSRYAGCLGFSAGDLIDYCVSRDGGMLKRLGERGMTPSTWTALGAALGDVKARRGLSKGVKGGKG